MNPTRKYFFKLALICFILILISSIWKIGAPWKLYVWGALGVFFLLGLIFPLGKPFHSLWLGYVKITTQGMRFFQGTAVFLGLISLYHFNVPGAGDYAVWVNGTGPYWAYGAAGVLLVGIIKPVAEAIFAAWMKLAGYIQIVVSSILLTLTYLIAVLPVGLLAKLVGKKFLDKQLEPEAESYWIDRNDGPFDRKRYHRHF